MASAFSISDTSTIRRSVIGFFLAAFTTVIFSPVHTNEFINFDDEVYVTRNPEVVKGLSWSGIAWAFTTTEASNWHPLTWLSLELDASIYGLRSSGFHLTSVVLHSVAAWLLFAFLDTTTHRLAASALAAALFAWHPLRVESVAWIAERKDVLSGLFLILCLRAYARYVHSGSRGTFILSIILAACGLMSKPMLVSLPILLLLIDYWPLDRLATSARRWSPRFLLLEKAPFVALAVASVGVTLVVQNQGGAILDRHQLPLAFRLENSLASIARYLEQSIWPVNLAVYYPYDLSSRLVVRAVIGAGLAICLSAVSVRCRRSRPYLFVGWFWFLIALTPVLGLIQVGTQSHADRYTYIPSIGLAIMVSWLVVEFAAACRLPRGLGQLAAASCLMALALLTWSQCSYWRDSVTLWSHALAINDRNYFAHYSLGLALRRQGDTDQAISHYQRAVELEPQFPDAHNNLGVALAQREQFADAAAQFRAALALEPTRHRSWFNLGTALSSMNDWRGACDAYRRAITLAPSSVQYYIELGYVLGRLEQHAQSAEAYQLASRLDSGWPERTRGLAWTYACATDPRRRNGREALRLATQITDAPGKPSADNFDLLAAANAEAGNFEAAVTFIQQAINLAGATGKSDNDLQALRHRLQLYQQHRPYRVPVPTGAGTR